jgi:hypothetical protein
MFHYEAIDLHCKLKVSCNETGKVGPVTKFGEFTLQAVIGNKHTNQYDLKFK